MGYSIYTLLMLKIIFIEQAIKTKGISKSFWNVRGPISGHLPSNEKYLAYNLVHLEAKKIGEKIKLPKQGQKNDFKNGENGNLPVFFFRNWYF